MHYVTLCEYKKLKIGDAISQRDASALLDVTDKGVHQYQGYLIAENYVGVITSRHGFVLEILPKIEFGVDSDNDSNNEKAKQVFLKMLRCYRGLKGSLPENESSIRSMSRFPMLDIFVRLFLIDLQKLIRSGLAHRYIPVEENLPYLRGRLLFQEHLRQNLVNASRLFVEHEIFSVNRPANRLIRSTLNRLGRRIRGEENQVLHHQMDMAFSDVPESINIRSDWKAHHIDRSMPLYRPVMQWVGLFLFDKGLTAYSGKHANISLLFPMEKVFEDFVSTAFRSCQKEYGVKTQGPQISMFEEKETYNMKPDIVLMKNEAHQFVLDAKWKKFERKRVDSKHKITQSDLYQIYAYSKRYKCKTVMLVYPQNPRFKDPLHFRFFDGNFLICMPFDCTQPDESVKQAIQWLERAIGDLTCDSY